MLKASSKRRNQRPELQGLASYVDESFPKTEDIPLIKTSTNPEGTVQLTVLNDVFSKIDAILGKLGSFPSLTLDLMVESEPPSATVIIRSKSPGDHYGLSVCQALSGQVFVYSLPARSPL